MKLSLEIKDFNMQTQFMTNEQIGMYVKLLSMLRQGVAVNDDAVIATFGLQQQIIFVNFITKDKDGFWHMESIDRQIEIDNGRKKNLIAGPKASTSKSKPKSKPKPKEEKKQNTEHKELIEIYHDWYLELFGVKPQIQAKDAATVKKILAWLHSNTNEGHQPLDGFRYVLSNWRRIDPWLQSKTDLSQISSNWNQIISQLQFKTTKNDREQQELDAAIQRVANS
jgi:uncharacterized protein YdaU (DUF1376 family)